MNLKLPQKLQQQLLNRKKEHNYRSLATQKYDIDFCSNDYLGLAKDLSILMQATQTLETHQLSNRNGATGSRLLSGNSDLHQQTEAYLSIFHRAEAALLFNSGYQANSALIATIPHKKDLVLYDQYIHASMRAGLQLGTATAYKFSHNDLEDLERKLKKHSLAATYEQIYVLTESVFSMDGDSPDLVKMAAICRSYTAYLIVDEAHATGVVGSKGEGLVSDLGLESTVFARVHTFGKAIGSHGAVVLGSRLLQSYLINFAKSFIYTTALPPHALATTMVAYKTMASGGQLYDLQSNIDFFIEKISRLPIKQLFIPSKSAIHCCIVAGNLRVKAIAKQLAAAGFGVQPILYPTVPKGQERLRICLHAYNSTKQITALLQKLSELIRLHPYR